MRIDKARIAGIAFIVVASTALGGCSIIGGVLDEATGGGSLEDSSVFSIKVGDCFTEPASSADGTVTDIEIVECGAAHDDEAYASVLMSDAEFPGDDATQAKAEDACLSRFFDFIGATSNYDGSLNFSYFYPIQESWDENDREILCYVFDEDGTSVGSLEGAER